MVIANVGWSLMRMPLLILKIDPIFRSLKQEPRPSSAMRPRRLDELKTKDLSKISRRKAAALREDDDDHTTQTRSGSGIREGRHPPLRPQRVLGIGLRYLDPLSDWDRCLSVWTRSRLCRCFDRQLLD